jgi:hypothetical protein
MMAIGRLTDMAEEVDRRAGGGEGLDKGSDRKTTKKKGRIKAGWRGRRGSSLRFFRFWLEKVRKQAQI